MSKMAGRHNDQIDSQTRLGVKIGEAKTQNVSRMNESYSSVDSFNQMLSAPYPNEKVSKKFEDILRRTSSEGSVISDKN